MHASSFSGVESADSTAAIERGRPIPSGTTVSGKRVRFCSARTATSKGSPLACAEKRRSSFVSGVGGAFSEGSGIRLILFPTHVDNQKSIGVVMSYRRSFNRSGKLDGLFETAVGDFHLMENKTIAIMCIASTTANTQHRVAYLDLQLIRTNAGQIDLHDPAIITTI